MAAISPGPAVLMAARIGVTEGLKTGFSVAFGIGMGAVFWAAAALFGLALLFEYAPVLLTLFKVAGGIFLIYMAYKLWKTADEPLPLESKNKVPRSLRSGFLLGLLTQLTNPKPAILFAAIFVGTVPESTGIGVYVALLTVVFLNETIWNTMVARIFSLNVTRTVYISLKGLIDRVFGGLLAVLGVKIAAT
ncbi:LysE family translocator [Amylibacter sp. SFDW26]|uniref:LysE family translocator n=1 Tax=Amylibacter sp. SFDW26 TaxID=2652722 RepID=UPI001D0334C5|nr:LysE family translocator [Amylibacter sp. SFDW26]